MRKLQGFIPLIVLLAITLAANAIATWLTALGSTPIIGFLFQALAFPFKFLAGFRVIIMIILAVLIIFRFVLPALKSIFGKFGKKRHGKAAPVVSDQAILAPQPPVTVAPQPPTSVMRAPTRMDAWNE